MKMMKKLATFLLAICLIVPCFAMTTYAADGSIQFTDPSTAVGETVEVTGAFKASGKTVGSISMDMTYDASMLKFKSGDNVTETASGQLRYSGEGTESTLRFNMSFDVLKEGTTKIEVVSYTSALSFDQGFSTVTIAPGVAPVNTEPEPVNPEPDTNSNTNVKVTVNGQEYELSEAFAETDIPEGFVETTLAYNGGEYKVVCQESSGIYLGYLVDANMVGDFFMYNSDDATFAPFEQIAVSDTTSIALLSDIENIELPEIYQKVKITLNGQDFPAWQNADAGDYYVLYAINNQGVKSLYQFDSIEGTYQRFETPKEEEKDTSFLGKLSDVLQEHLDYVILGVGLGFLVFLLLVLVLGIKLYNRNVELDELYDEYGIDLDEDDEVTSEVPKKSEKNIVGKDREVEKEILGEEDLFEDGKDDLDAGSESNIEETFEDEFGNEFDDEFNDEFEDDSDDGEYDVDFIDLDD